MRGIIAGLSAAGGGLLSARRVGKEVGSQCPVRSVRLALAAALERVATWSGVDPRDDAVAVQAGRELERQARLAVVAAVKRLRADGRTWRDLATLLGLDSETLGTPIADKAELAFAYCAGLPRAPTFVWPSLIWGCRSCGEMVVDLGPDVKGDEDELGHAAGCRRLTTHDVAGWGRGGC